MLNDLYAVPMKSPSSWCAYFGVMCLIGQHYVLVSEYKQKMLYYRNKIVFWFMFKHMLIWYRKHFEWWKGKQQVKFVKILLILKNYGWYMKEFWMKKWILKGLIGRAVLCCSLKNSKVSKQGGLYYEGCLRWEALFWIWQCRNRCGFWLLSNAQSLMFTEIVIVGICLGFSESFLS